MSLVMPLTMLHMLLPVEDKELELQAVNHKMLHTWLQRNLELYSRRCSWGAIILSNLASRTLNPDYNYWHFHEVSLPVQHCIRVIKSDGHLDDKLQKRMIRSILVWIWHPCNIQRARKYFDCIVDVNGFHSSVSVEMWSKSIESLHVVSRAPTHSFFPIMIRKLQNRASVCTIHVQINIVCSDILWALPIVNSRSIPITFLSIL